MSVVKVMAGTLVLCGLLGPIAASADCSDMGARFAEGEVHCKAPNVFQCSANGSWRKQPASCTKEESEKERQLREEKEASSKVKQPEKES